ncbi:hypothetical protein NPIL_50801 [Nephila pilipes]|uniref:Uncharacterized protein n=1 Tax=Nephila pilipes TaxID=299642 RepID=A0A8X6NKJ8_NEPPI|nr:hypothetical protein NPIL_50801 [Nephila pilipes]
MFPRSLIDSHPEWTARGTAQSVGKHTLSLPLRSLARPRPTPRFEPPALPTQLAGMRKRAAQTCSSTSGSSRRTFSASYQTQRACWPAIPKSTPKRSTASCSKRQQAPNAAICRETVETAGAKRCLYGGELSARTAA